MTTQGSGQVAGSGRWLVLIAMTGSLSMVLLDQTVVSVALPTMMKDIPLSPGGVHWIVSAYVLSMAAFVALGGRLGDWLGAITTFRMGVWIFFLASCGCGVVPHGAWGEPVILIFRALQGIGAALMLPASEAVVTNTFSMDERGKAMAVYVGVGQIFLAVGPLLGGFLTEWVSWRAVFWLNLPVGIMALVLVHLVKPADTRTAIGRPSFTVLLTLVGGMALFILGVQEGPNFGWRSPITIASIIVGLVALAWVVRNQWRSADPLIDVRAFVRPGLGGDLIVIALVQFALLGLVLYGTIYLQSILDFSPLTAGAATLPLVLAIAASAQLGGRWFDRSGVRAPVLTGLAVSAAGVTIWAVSLTLPDYLTQLPGMIITGLGLGLVQSPANVDALSRADASERTQVSGLIQTLRQTGGTVGVAVIGGVVLTLAPAGASSTAPGPIAAGFAVGAAALAIACVAGSFLLARGRLKAT